VAVEVVQLGCVCWVLILYYYTRGTVYNDRVTHPRKGKESDGGESVSYHLYISRTTS